MVERTRPNSKDTTMADLEASLQIDEHALETELRENPDLFYQVASGLALSISKRDEAKQQLDDTEAVVDIELRRDAAKSEDRVTEKELESNRKTDKRVREASKHFNDARADTGRWTALKEAYEQRSYALSKLADLYIANYYSDSSQHSHRPEQSIRSTKADQARTTLNERRRSSQ